MSQQISDLSYLIAEDTKTNQILFVNLLKVIGAKDIDVAHDGLQAFEMAVKKNYHIILMDHLMPHLDGVEATKKILTEAKGRKPHIIALSAHYEREYQELYQKAGMSACLKKPLKKEDLQSCIQAYLNNTVFLSKVEEENTHLDDVLDYPYLDANFSKNPQILARVYKTAEKEMDPLIKKIEESLAQQSFDDLLLYAHRMKGMLSNLGGKKSSFFAKKLEHSGKEKILNSDVLKDFENLKKELTQFSLAINDYIRK